MPGALGQLSSHQAGPTAQVEFALKSHIDRPVLTERSNIRASKLFWVQDLHLDNDLREPYQ